MVKFRHVALLHAQPRVPLTHAYHIADLIELCGLAASVRDHVDDVTIPVAPTDRDPLAAFERFMKRRRPDLVGISCFTCSARSAVSYAETAARYGAYVIMGGYHPSALPEEMLASSAVEAVVRGEGELSLVELVKSGSPEGIDGISYRSNGSVIHNPDRPVIDDLDALPLPLRELRPPRFGLEGLDYHTDTVFASRGCRGSCTFCANHLVGRRWRQRSNEHVLAELLSIPPSRNGRPKFVKFWDSNFLTRSERIEKLCDMILENGLERRFRFIAETRAEDVIRAEPILGKMHQAGFVRVGCGIESPSRETHKHLRKGLNLAHIERAAELLTSNNMLFSKFLIVGHASEGVDDILEYPEYSLSHGVELQNTTFMVMTPYPTTELARAYEEKGLIKIRDWDLYTNFGAVIEPNGISTRQLQTLLCSVLTSYGVARRYLLGSRFSRVLGRLFETLLVHIQIALMHPHFTEKDVAISLWEALASIQGERERDVNTKRKPKALDQVTLVFHCEDRSPIEVGVLDRGDREALSIRVLEDAAEPHQDLRPGARRLHLEMSRLVTLTRRLDLRIVAHDLATFTWSRRGFKLVWVPSLLRNIGVLGASLLGMAGFHLRHSRLGSSRRNR